eukprot:1140082-Pelagomonas_calceolata.AAC.6
MSKHLRKGSREYSAGKGKQQIQQICKDFKDRICLRKSKKSKCQGHRTFTQLGLMRLNETLLFRKKFPWKLQYFVFKDAQSRSVASAGSPLGKQVANTTISTKYMP